METGDGASRASGLNHSIFIARKGALELMMPLEGLSNVARDRGELLDRTKRKLSHIAAEDRNNSSLGLVLG